MQVPIRSDAYPEIPACVYRLYDSARTLLYVGVAEDFDARFRQHAKTKDWWPQVAHRDVTWFTRRLDALWEEARAIATERPVHNQRPGLGHIGLVLVQHRDKHGYDVCPAQPELVMSTFWQARVIETVCERNGHALITDHGEPVSALIPIDYYRRACAAMGTPTDL